MAVEVVAGEDETEFSYATFLNRRDAENAEEIWDIIKIILSASQKKQ